MGRMTRLPRTASLGLAFLAILAGIALVRRREGALDDRTASTAARPDRVCDPRLPGDPSDRDESSPVASRSRAAAAPEVRFYGAPVVRQEPDGPVRVSSDGYEQTFSTEDVRLAFGDSSLSLRLKDLRIGGRSVVPADSLSSVAPRLEKGTRDEVVYQRGEVAEKYLLKGGDVEQVFVLSEALAPWRDRGPLSVVVALASALHPVRRAGTPGAPGDRIEFSDGFGMPVLTYGAATAIDASGRTQPLGYALRGSDLEMTLDAGFLASAAFPLTIDPTISVTPASLTFNAPLSGPNPAPQAVIMKNTSATASLRWKTVVTTTSGGAWLSCNPTKGRRKPLQSKSVSVSVAMTTLAEGTYTGNIRFVEQTDATNFVDLPVTLNVRGLPFIAVQPAAGLTFNAPTGSGLQPTQDLTLTNQGGQTLNWTLAFATVPPGGTWLVGVTPTSGSLPGGAFAPLTVTVDATGLVAGTYAGTVTVSGNATNSPVSTPVQMIVSDLPFLDVSWAASAGFPASMDFTGPVGNPAPIFQDVTIRNGGGSPLNWSIDTTVPFPVWLSVNPLSGTGILPGQTVNPAFQVSVSATGLPVGIYTYTLVIAGNASNAPVNIPVTFTIEDLPLIDVQPLLLTFDAPLGGPDPAPQIVTVANQGGGTLNWTAVASGGTWLSISRTGGSETAGASEDVQVLATVGALAAGIYGGTVQFDDGSGTGPLVSVTFNVNANPKIQLTPTSLVIDVPFNGSPATATVDLQNVGDGATPLAWTAASGAPWLSVGPAAGNVPSGGTTPLTVTVDPSGLVAGAYVGQITVDSTNATNAPRTVSVTMNVNFDPKIKLTPSSLVFDVPQNGAAAQDTVTLQNVGDSAVPLDFATSVTTGNGGAWLGVTPASGSLSSGQSAPLTVTATPGILAAGTYTGLVRVDSTSGSNAPQQVFVTMNVNANPKIRLAPTNVVFDLPAGGIPAGTTVTLDNVGGGGTPLAFTASSNAAWLSVAPASGNVAAGTSQALTVTATPGVLAAGSYSGLVTLASGNATNAPQLVFVTMNLSGEPRIGLSPSSLTFITGVTINPPNQQVTVTNTGGLTLNWTATSSVSTPPAGAWLSLSGTTTGSLTAGLSAPPFDAVVDVTGLAAGTYVGTITVTAPATSNSPQPITVTLNVSASPAIGLSPPSLTFNVPISGPNPGNQAVIVSNPGGGTLNWSATSSISTPAGGTWLSLSGTTSGSVPGGNATFDAAVDITGLAAGTYSGAIDVSDPLAGNDPQSILVTLKVLASPSIGLSAPLVFNATWSGPNPANQTVTVTNVGDQTLDWSAASSVTTPPGGTWLSLVPGAPLGSIIGNGFTAAFGVAVDLTGLPAGTYTGMITVTGNSTNSPQTIGVTLNIVDIVALTSNAARVGYCGAVGLEFLLPLGLIRLCRRRRAAGGPRESRS